MHRDLPKVLKNFTAFVDGNAYLGKVTELEPPKLKLKMNGHRAGSMDAEIKIDMGMEPLEATATFAEYTPDLFKKFGILSGDDVMVTFRGAVRRNGAEAEAVIIDILGTFEEMDPGSWKAGDDSSLKVKIAINYYQLEIAGEELIEIDVPNSIRKIDGVDQLESVRSALGIK